MNHVDIEVRIQRDASCTGYCGIGSADIGDRSHIAITPRRVDNHAAGRAITLIPYINVAGWIHRDPVRATEHRIGPSDGGSGCHIAAAAGRIYGHTAAAETVGIAVPRASEKIRYIDIPAGVERNLVGPGEEGVAAANRCEGRHVAVATG